MTARQLPEAERGVTVTSDGAGDAGRAYGRLAIRKWLTEYLAYLLEQPAASVDTALTFDRHGLDSAAAVALVADIEDWMGIELDPTIVYDYPTVDELTDYLVSRSEALRSE